MVKSWTFSAAALLAVASMATTEATLDYGVKLYGINYDRRQAPDWDANQCKTEDQVWADMKLISAFSKSVRVYGLSEGACHTSHVINAAKSNGMTVLLGVWTAKNTQGVLNTADELRKLEGLLATPGLIDNQVTGIVVGSEAVYRGDLTADEAVTYLNKVRDLRTKYGQTKDTLPVTIADTVDAYYQNAQLLQAVDYVALNQFTFWEKKDINEGMAIMLDRIRSIRIQAAQQGKEVLISETGWSSGGSAAAAGVASLANQKKFFEDFYHQAVAHDLKYYWFSAIDLTWLLKVDTTSTVEAYFGVLDENKNFKASFQNLNLKPRQRTTFQSTSGRYLAETYNPNKIEEVAGVEQIEASSDKFTELRYGWFFDQDKGQIRSLNSDRCLDAYEAWNGGTVHTYTCVETERNQKWSYDSTTKQLKHASHTGFCLDNDPAQNYKLQLYGCSDNNANQQWDVSSVAVTESTTVRFFAKESTDFAQLVRSGEEIAVGTGAAGAASSEWIYDETTKLVKSKDSNYCLDAYEGWAGGRVHVWSCNADEKNQRWNFDSSTGQFQHATWSGYCLDRDPSGANGGKLQLWGCHLNNNNQVWRKISASAKAVRITNADQSVVEWSSRNSLQLTSLTKSDGQSWFYNSFSNKFTNKWSGECLDADQSVENSLVHTWDCIATEGNQKWKFENGQIKHVTRTGFCLAYKSSSEKVLVLKKCSTSDATQSFTLPAASA